MNAGGTTDFHFHVEGYRSKQAWIMVRASDGTNHWNSDRALALQRVCCGKVFHLKVSC